MTETQEHDARISLALDAALVQLREAARIDVAGFQLLYPDLADELPGLLETLRAVDSAVEDCRDATGVTEAEPAGQSAASAEPLPEQIGRYCIIEHLGAGGMGTVYRAHDPQLDRDVALKVPRFDRDKPGHAVAMQRFLREAKAAAKVHHANVCPIHDAGEHDGSPYAVMEFIEGTSLAGLLRSEPLPVPRAVELTRKVALALEAVHAQGIVHRDLKPANVLLNAAGEPFLTDFGLARPVEDGEHLTQEGMVVGTPAYLAPEQALGQNERIGPATDLYSLGVMLYQMLTGRLPFAGAPLSILYQTAQTEPPSPRSLRPDIDAGLEAIVLKAMAKKPEERYPTAREFAEALGAWRVPAASPTDESVAYVPTGEWAKPVETPRRWRRWPWLAAAAVLLAVTGEGSSCRFQTKRRLRSMPTATTAVARASRRNSSTSSRPTRARRRSRRRSSPNATTGRTIPLASG